MNANEELYIYESINESSELIRNEKIDEAIDKLREIIYIVESEDYYLEYYINAMKLLALCYRKKKEYEKAAKLLEKLSRSLHKEFLKKGNKNNYQKYAVAIVNLGIVYESNKEYDKAKAEYLQAKEIFEKVNDSNSLFKLHLTLCHLYTEMKNFEGAIKCIEEAQRIAIKENIVYDESMIESYIIWIKEKENENN